MKLTYTLKLIIFFSLQIFTLIMYKLFSKEKKSTFTEKLINIYIPSTKQITGTLALIFTVLKKITNFQNLFSYLVDIVSTITFLVVAIEVVIRVILNIDLLKLLNFSNPNILLNNKIQNK